MNRNAVIVILLAAVTGIGLADDTLWTRTIEPNQFSDAADIWCQGTDVFICGSAGDTLGADAFAAKYSGSGNLEWSSTVDIDTFEAGAAISCGSDGNPAMLIMTGTMQPTVIVTKLDGSGDTLWTRSQANALGMAVAVDAGNNIYVYGTSGTSTPDENLWLARYSPTGTQEWSREYQLGMMHQAIDICFDGSGNLFATAGVFDTISQMPYLVKFDTNGDTVWARGYDQEFAFVLLGISPIQGTDLVSVAQDINGAKLVRFDASGDTVWTTHTPPGTSPDVGTDASGNAYVAFSDQDLDFKIDQYGPDGTFLGTGVAGYPGDAFPNALAVGSDGNPVVTGATFDTISTRVLTVKFSGVSGAIADLPSPRIEPGPCRLLGSVSDGRGISLAVNVAGTYGFDVLDVDGRLVHSTGVDGRSGVVRLELPGLPAGVHFVRVRGTSSSRTLRFVVCD